LAVLTQAEDAERRATRDDAPLYRGGEEGSEAFVYVIAAGASVHKIGTSKRSPMQRLRALQTGCHERLTLVGVASVPVADIRGIEKRAHLSLARQRRAGEWFEVSAAEAIAAVERAAGVPCSPPVLCPATLYPHPFAPYGRLYTMNGRQLRAARALLDWTAEALAEASRVGINTIRRAEAVSGPVRMTAANAHAVRQALEQAGIEFIAENGGGPGVRMRKPEA
jgi:hypothetical protein